ncbi:MAG: hypothetical protein ABL974_01140 [Prosthecobacter sp.]
MFLATTSFASLMGFAPLASEHWILLVILMLLGAGGAWYFQEKKTQALKLEQADQEAAHASAVKSLKTESATQAATAQQKLDDAATAHKLLEERHATLRETAQRRELDADQRIANLNTDLTAAREIAAQLEPAKVRISDLETALSSERGRVSALEQTVVVSNKRADDFERRLDQSQAESVKARYITEQREGELQAEIAKLDQTIKDNVARVESVDNEIATHTAYKQQSETRITNLQRQLAAAEAKSALVQKEFMSAVGTLPQTPAVSSRAPASADDKRVAELEAKLTQAEAEARKKAREDSYKIAELEFRLSEAIEALAKKE